MTTQVAKITLMAPAKINLFLHVTGRRDNGYHELQSVFRRLELADQLEISVKRAPPEIRVDAPELLGQPEDNLVESCQGLFRPHNVSGVLEYGSTSRFLSALGLAVAAAMQRAFCLRSMN